MHGTMNIQSIDGWQTDRTLAMSLYVQGTPEIERNIYIENHRRDGRYHPHSEHMGGRRGVSIDGVVLVVPILIP
jgi:hypothetical protein